MVGGIYIGLGSNVGNKTQNLREALQELESAGDIRVLRCSSFHDTAPVGGPPGQDRFLNAVAELATDLSPRELLTRMQEIEQRHGRVRTVANGPRTLDLDLLLFRDQRIDEPDLNVPHPRMWERAFVLEPLAELTAIEGLPHRPPNAATHEYEQNR